MKSVMWLDVFVRCCLFGSLGVFFVLFVSSVSRGMISDSSGLVVECSGFVELRSWPQCQ